MVDFGLRAELLKALADANRLKILYSISEKEKSVSQIIEENALSQPLVSHHLRILRENGFVIIRRQGPFIYYSIADKEILNLLLVLERLVEKFGEKWAKCKIKAPLFSWCKKGGGVYEYDGGNDE